MGQPSDGILPLPLQKASEQFNAHEFWECHETLEPLWLKASGPERPFFQGIIQVAAGFVHVTNCNYTGAISLLNQGLEKLMAIQNIPLFQSWIHLSAFIEDVLQAKAEIERLGPERLERFCPGHFPELTLND